MSLSHEERDRSVVIILDFLWKYYVLTFQDYRNLENGIDMGSKLKEVGINMVGIDFELVE